MGATVDIATLGLEVRSDGVVVASDRLRRLQQEGGAAESAANSLSSAFSNLNKYMMAAAAAFGASMGISGFISQVKAAISAIDALKIATIQIAAQITTMQGPKNVAEHYKEATVYANALAVKLQEVDAKSFANYDTLLKMVSTMAMQGVLLDVNNKKQVESFTALSNAVAMYTVGQNQSMQAHQEIRALMSGEVRQGAQLAIQIDGLAKSSGLYKNGLKDIVAEGKKHEDTLERLAPFLTGINAASSDIATTWTAVSSSMDTAISAVRRAGFDTIFQEAVKQAGELVGHLKEHADIIGNRIQQGWLAVRGILESIWSLLSAFKEPLEIAGGLTSMIVKGWALLATSVFPPLLDRLSAFIKGMWETVKLIGNVANMAGKIVIGDYGGAAEAWNSAKANFKQGGIQVGKAFRSGFLDEVATRSNEFLALDNIKKAAASKVAIPILPKGANTESGDTATTVNERKYLEDLERVRESARKVNDAYDKLTLSDINNANTLQAEVLKNRYSQGLIDEQTYLSKKYQLNKAASDKEVAQLNEAALRAQKAFENADNAPEYHKGDSSTPTDAVAITRRNTALSEYIKAWEELQDVKSKSALLDAKYDADTQAALDKQVAAVERLSAELATMQDATNAMAAALVGVNPATGGIDSIADQTAHDMAIQQTAHEQLMNQYDAQISAIEELRDAKTISFEEQVEYDKKIIELEKQKALSEQDNANKTAKIQHDAVNSQLSMFANYASTAANLLDNLANSQDKSSRSGFEAAKKYSLAAAVMNTAAAIVNALATANNIYVGVAMAAMAAATGAAQIAKIKATSYGGSADAGTAPVGSFNSGSSASSLGSNSGIGSSIGKQYSSVYDQQSQESLQKLAKSADSASLAIGKVADGLTSIASLFESDSSFLSLAVGSLPSPALKYSNGLSKSLTAIKDLTLTTLNPLTILNPLTMFNSISNVVSGLKTALFGGHWYTKSAGLALSLSGETVNAYDYLYRKKDGGLFGKSKKKYVYSDDSTWTGIMQTVIDSITSTISHASVAMGTSANFSAAKLGLTRIQTTGRSEEDITKDLQAWLESAANELAKTVVGLKEYTFYNENAYDALVRLSTALQDTNEKFELIGATLINSTLAGANSAYKLQQLFGGTDAFDKAIDTYFTSMFSDEEQKAQKAAQAARQVNTAFAEMGIAVPKTKEQFRSLVNSLDVTTDSGAALFAALINVSSAFGTEIDYATELAKTNYGVMETLWEDEGRAVEALALKRQLEISSMDETTKAIQFQVYAMEDLTSAYSTLKDSVSAEKTALETQYNTDTAAQQTIIDNLGTSISAVQSLSDALKSTIDSLTSSATTTTTWAAALSTIDSAIASAKAGTFVTSDSLSSALNVLKSPNADNYSTLVDYTRAKDQAVARLNELQGLADAQLTDTQKALAVAKAQLQTLKDTYTANVAALDAILATAQKQIDATTGTTSATLSVAAAVQAMTAAVNSVGAALAASAASPAASSAASSRSVFSEAGYLAKNPDVARAVARGEFKSGYQHYVEYGVTEGRSYAVGTQYVPYDMTAQIHQGEIIVDRASADILRRYGVPSNGAADNRELVEEIKMLRSEQRIQAAEFAKHQKKMSQIIDKWDVDGMPAVAV